jgi:hypothetical protein
MSSKDVEEKMHLDETKCCSRKRKRRRQLTVSTVDDVKEEDFNYIPSDKQSDSSAKNRKRQIMHNVYNNGFLDHEYYCNSNSSSKTETDIDPTDLMIPCEQTMIEGDMEIISPNNSYTSPDITTPKDMVMLIFICI